MHRILTSLIVILWSVWLYLSLRVFKKHNVTPKIQNAVMFVPTACVFILWASIAWEKLWIGREMFMIMIPVCLLFSWLPNLMSLKSLQSAPNPWYSLMIAKSYVALAAIIAVPLLWSTLKLTDVVAILLIIWFMSLILISPRKEETKTSSSRIRQAFYAHIWRAWLALASAWFINQWMSPLVVNAWIFGLVSLLIIWEWLIANSWIVPPTKSYLPALWVVVSMVVFNRALQEWYATAPNPWYINAANASSIALLTLLSAWIFWDELSTRKVIGIVGVIVGISALFVF